MLVLIECIHSLLESIMLYYAKQKSSVNNKYMDMAEGWQMAVS